MVGVQSAPLKVEIVIATVGVCFTLFLVGVVLAIILGHKIKIKSHKPESKDLNTEESPVDYHSQMYDLYVISLHIQYMYSSYTLRK